VRNALANWPSCDAVSDVLDCTCHSALRESEQLSGTTRDMSTTLLERIRIKPLRAQLTDVSKQKIDCEIQGTFKSGEQRPGGRSPRRGTDRTGSTS